MPRKYLEPTDGPQGLRTLMVRYLEWMKVTATFTEATIRGREQSLAYFADWCAERTIGRTQDITRPTLERYQRHLFALRKADG